MTAARRQPESPELDARSRQLLRALVSEYIREGAPVGSRTLAKRAGIAVSAATIRNVMADLEDIGLVATPHTSAGRVPTALGYRLFVDALLPLRPLGAKELDRLRHRMPDQAGTQALLANASEALSAMSRFVGLVTVPGREDYPFRHIDFVPIAPRKVLVILVFSDNEVQNRLIATDRDFDPSELERIANYLNTQHAGQTLPALRERLLEELRTTRDDMHQLVESTVDLAERALGDSPAETDVVMSGQTRLMQVADLSDIARLRELFEAFARKREILELLRGCNDARGVRVFIGEESGFAPLGDCAVVGAPYGVGDRHLGVLAVIGPKRMAYDRVIPMVRATADLLGDALGRQGG